MNKDVVRRFYEAVLRTPGGPDFATIKELTDEQEVELDWGPPRQRRPPGIGHRPGPARPGTRCTS